MAGASVAPRLRLDEDLAAVAPLFVPPVAGVPLRALAVDRDAAVVCEVPDAPALDGVDGVVLPVDFAAALLEGDADDEPAAGVRCLTEVAIATEIVCGPDPLLPQPHNATAAAAAGSR